MVRQRSIAIRGDTYGLHVTLREITGVFLYDLNRLYESLHGRNH